MPIRYTNVSMISPECLAILRKIFEEASFTLPYVGSLATELYCTVSLIFLSYINQKESGTLKTNLEKIVWMDSHNSWKQAEEYFSQLAVNFLTSRAHEHMDHDQDLIQRIHTYVERHLNEDLTLIRLAEVVFLNPSYLSRLYKQMTGITLSEHISQMRIKRATELLIKPSVKMQYISQQLGFQSPSYFSQFFKKMTGMTPQEYRGTLEI